ncbi:MAG: alpha/beta hydrolase [Nocardiaceae bacterium]|nr:alpha/beta hydrolase [Nocardiaceae bacterium]
MSTWFGDDDAPLLGHVHVPGDTARGAVVLCPPVAKEHIDTYRGLSVAADRLARAGILTLRFDYRGVGDSSGDQHSDTLWQDWVSSGISAVEFMRRWGAETVALVGLRLGAIVAAEVAVKTEAASTPQLVLWDPVLSGRSFLRAQKMLYQVGVGPEITSNGLVHIPGADLSEPAAKTISDLRLRSMATAGVARDVLVAARTEVLNATDTRELAAEFGGDILGVDGHAEFTEPREFVGVAPQRSIEDVVNWIDKRIPDRRFPITPIVVTTARVRRLESDKPAVLETIDRIGPDGLFAIRTSSGDVDQSVSTFVFHATAQEHRIGPSRLWVDLARDVAARGAVSLRFDRRGTGETGFAQPGEVIPVYGAESDHDARIATVAAGSTPNVRHVVGVGICSGAYAAAHAAIESGSAETILVNMAVWRLRAKKITAEQISKAAGPKVFERSRTTFKAMMPARMRDMWVAFRTRGRRQSPLEILRPLQERGVVATLVFGPNDYRRFRANRGIRALGKLARRGPAPLVIASPSGDHTGYDYHLRTLVRDAVLDVARAQGESMDARLASPGAPRADNDFQQVLTQKDANDSLVE